MLQQALAELSTTNLIFLILAIIAVCAFEFVNGFHDTANAVATVIYTKSLKPLTAVIWSGSWNFLGVWLGGIAVAMSIMNLLPVAEMMTMSQGENITIVFAVLLTAISWNIATWFLGIPCSSSHTMIGSILGAGMGFFWVHGGHGVNWHKAQEIGLSLLLSPAFGFSLVILLLFLFKTFIKNKAIFKDPSQNNNQPPPLWIRFILLSTCTLVSFFHGNNDGQKGVGIMMIVLLAMLPGYYALNPEIKMEKLELAITTMREATKQYKVDGIFDPHHEALSSLDELESEIPLLISKEKGERVKTRKTIQAFSKKIKPLLNDPEFLPEADQKKEFKRGFSMLKDFTDYAPLEAILLISLSLGFGTMIGWKRIVVTIGEKIGKTHLTYAQGAIAELVAAATIGLSSGYGLPVSTTHVLSSGIAGSMVGMGGVKNLQKSTIMTIAIAWVLTLPVTFIGALGFYYLFQWIL
ncbi:MAG: inorganic phosphate transporter [Saprospiraceae bacterium]|uniref:Phosphate transporter n=1 Tax=Candidatus Opimibacter skivensis TaxID=2982028 RepID=A0A9D7SR37_9BACT|nr:inorganic phosphate transporter [Candidatus Opimibacter skivensis]